MVFVLGIQLKPNVCWQSGLPSPYAFLFYLSVLSAPSSTALSSILLHPDSSRAGKEGEKLTYLRDIQEPVSGIQQQLNYFLLGMC